MPYFKFAFEGEQAPSFIVEQTSDGLTVHSNDEQYVESMTNAISRGESKTVEDLVGSGFSYWDIDLIEDGEFEAVLAETVAPEETEEVVDVTAEVDVEEEVPDNEGSDPGPDSSDEGTGGAPIEEPRLPRRTP